MHYGLINILAWGCSTSKNFSCKKYLRTNYVELTQNQLNLVCKNEKLKNEIFKSKSISDSLIYDVIYKYEKQEYSINLAIFVLQAYQNGYEIVEWNNSENTLKVDNFQEFDLYFNKYLEKIGMKTSAMEYNDSIK